MVRYEIVLDGKLVDSTDMSGIAFIKFDSAKLLGDAELFRIVETGDPVTEGRYQYVLDEWVYKSPPTPPCPPIGKYCEYRVPCIAVINQSNALRVETIAPTDRCGWSLKDGRVGGKPEDYLVCRR